MRRAGRGGKKKPESRNDVLFPLSATEVEWRLSAVTASQRRKYMTSKRFGDFGEGGPQMSQGFFFLTGLDRGQ